MEAVQNVITTLEVLLTAPSMLSASTERKQPPVVFITKIMAAFDNAEQKPVALRLPPPSVDKPAR